MAAPDPRSAGIRRVLLITLLLNLLVAAAKGAYGAWTGSLAIASDGVHSLVDAGVNVIGLLTMRAATAPPDADHPYGHGKIEIVASAGIGVAVGVTAVLFAWNAIAALASGHAGPETPHPIAPSVRLIPNATKCGRFAPVGRRGQRAAAVP